jgi:hypothetical protein
MTRLIIFLVSGMLLSASIKSAYSKTRYICKEEYFYLIDKKTKETLIVPKHLRDFNVASNEIIIIADHKEKTLTAHLPNFKISSWNEHEILFGGTHNNIDYKYKLQIKKTPDQIPKSNIDPTVEIRSRNSVKLVENFDGPSLDDYSTREFICSVNNYTW